jgi:hypothetical protein
MGSGDEDDEEAWWIKPVWETEDEIEPPGNPRSRQAVREPDYTHPLLGPLARAQDAVARLEARAEAATPGVAEGLRARLAFREAAGWLAYSHVWIHPRDLALRDAGLTGSYGPAANAGRLEAELPATTAAGSDFEVGPSDRAVDQALRLAASWRRLAEFRTWTPLADAAALRDALQFLGCVGAPIADIENWLALIHHLEQGPLLVRAGCAARDWMNRPQVTKPLTQDGIFLAACLWRQGGGRALTLPFWLASEQRLNRLALRIGLEWMAAFLDCVADAAKAGLADLSRLQMVADKAQSLNRTARSKLPAAFDIVLRAPVMTARGLADRLDVTPQAALALLRQLLEAGMVREATGRASWRAFVVI